MLGKTKQKSKVIDQGSAKPDYGFSGGFLTVIQNIGKALVYPVAVLPFAALLMRIGIVFENLGTTDGVHETFLYWFGFCMQVPGSAVFDNLPVIFAMGVSFGFAKDHRGEAAVVAAIAYFIIIGLVQNEGSLTSLIYHNVLTTDVYAANPEFGVVDGAPEYIFVDSYSKLLYLTPNVLNDADQVIGEPVWLLNLGVFAGIEAGLISAYCYNRWSDTQLPPALGFFSGRRFVPMVIISVMIAVSFATAIIWPWFQIILIEISLGLVYIPWLGAGAFAFINRLLLPFGLHNILNTFFYFQMPITYEGQQVMFVSRDAAYGITGTAPLLGDLNAYINAGDLAYNGIYVPGMEGEMIPGTDIPFSWTTPQSAATGTDAYIVMSGAHVGAFETGYFPVLMAGVPAVALAMAWKADKEFKKPVMAFMAAGAAVAFISGITEPVEYSFMFISPILYFSYAVLSGFMAAITVATGISFSYGFSAGLIDLIASVPTSGNLFQVAHPEAFMGWPLLIMVVLLVFSFCCYFALGYFFIEWFKIPTPGRMGNMTAVPSADGSDSFGIDSVSPTMGGGKKTKGKVAEKQAKFEKMAKDTVNLVGGIDNIYDVDNCITRVRMKLKSNDYTVEEVTALGYHGYLKQGKSFGQFIIGMDAELVAKLIQKLIDERWRDPNQPVEKEISTEPIEEKKLY